MIGRGGVSTKASTILAAALLLGLSGAARAEGELVRDAMSSIGLIEPERPNITYRERAPLAMPPKLGTGQDLTAGLPLPQPRRSDPISTKDSWPKDPEIRARERAASEAHKPIVRGAQGRMNDNNETLSAAEIQGGRRAGAELPTEPVVRPGDTRDSVWLNPLNLFKDAKSEPSSEVEPEREDLSDPPTGYRKPLVKVAKPGRGPVGNSISGNEEADPRAYMRAGGR